MLGLNKEEYSIQPRKWPILPVLLGFFTILLSLFVLWYLSIPSFGQPIDLPGSVISEIQKEFRRTEKRDLAEVNAYYCSKPFDFETRYVAEVRLEYSYTGDFETSFIRNLRTYWKVGITNRSEGITIVKLPSFEKDGKNFPMPPCNLMGDAF
ncbi:MAG: hypothetical protein KF855_17760 [Acidobacteria bacterium]|nr:hypothetical protein [Acidobacteriota bacterium]